jgi:hypothetical protein
MRFLLVILALATGAPTPAFAQKDGAYQTDSLTIRVCNSSGRNAFSAVIYRDSGVWHSAGWYPVNNGECRDIATSDNLRFYVFAEEIGNIDYSWSGTFEHCIWRPGPYDDVISPDAKECQDGQESVMFSEWVADSYGTFTWTLDP